MNRLVCTLVVTMFCGISPQSAVADSQGVPLNLRRLTENAQRIILGTVVSRETGVDPLSLPATVYRIRVDAVLKGSAPATLTIKQFGVAEPMFDRAKGLLLMPVLGIPVYAVGEQYLLFLNGDSEHGFTAPVGLGYGAFHVQDGQINNDIGNAGLFVPLPGDPEDGADAGAPHPPLGPLPLDAVQAPVREQVARFVREAAPSNKAAAVDPVLTARQAIDHTRVLEVYSNIGALFNNHPFRFNVATADNPSGSLASIGYSVETGKLGTATNTAAAAAVANSFALWSAPSTVTLPVTQSPGTLGVDVNATCTGSSVPNPSATCYLNFFSASPPGANSIIFDDNGAITQQLTGSPCGFGGLGGFNGITFDGGITYDLRSYALYDGGFIGGQCNGSGTLTDFSSVITHELGHFLALGHTIVNGQLKINQQSFQGSGVPPCASIEIMLSNGVICEQGATRPNVLQKDDIASVSRLYPSAAFATTGKISGMIFTPLSAPQDCANVVLRNPQDPFFDAFGTISGVSKDFANPRPAGQAGSWSQQGLVLGNSYLVQATQIFSQATNGSGLTGLCDPPPTMPGPDDFYNGLFESADPQVDNPVCFTAVQAGANVTGINITFNSNANSSVSCNIPAATFLPASTFAFGTVFPGPNPAHGDVKLTNTGTGTLNITNSSVTGTGFTLFSKTCGASLAASANCIFTVAYQTNNTTPGTGALTVTTDAAGSPHQIAISAVGGDFVVALTRPGRPVRTQANTVVTAGAERVFDLMLTPPTGLTGSFALECSAPGAWHCRIEPATFQPDSGKTVQFALRLSSPARMKRLETGLVPASLIVHIQGQGRAQGRDFTVSVPGQ